MKLHVAPADQQPAEFAFTEENVERARATIAKYPEGRQLSAVLPLLQMAQAQHDNWLPRAAMDHVADFLEVPRIKVYEVATFYSQFNLAPVGGNFVQVCTTTPCWLRGSDDLVKVCKSRIAERQREISADGKFTWIEVECLGACVNAPMVQINDDYYEDLTAERLSRILDLLERGETVPVGSQTGRAGSQAQAGPTSLQHMRSAGGEG